MSALFGFLFLFCLRGGLLAAAPGFDSDVEDVLGVWDHDHVLLGLDLATVGEGRNVIVEENQKEGSPPSEWDIYGSGHHAIQGFATASRYYLSLLSSLYVENSQHMDSSHLQSRSLPLSPFAK